MFLCMSESKYRTLRENLSTKILVCSVFLHYGAKESIGL
jgi:hypothetical protein